MLGELPRLEVDRGHPAFLRVEVDRAQLDQGGRVIGENATGHVGGRDHLELATPGGDLLLAADQPDLDRMVQVGERHMDEEGLLRPFQDDRVGGVLGAIAVVLSAVEDELAGDVGAGVLDHDLHRDPPPQLGLAAKARDDRYLHGSAGLPSGRLTALADRQSRGVHRQDDEQDQPSEATLVGARAATRQRKSLREGVVSH
ncbi:MAG: hypothetical protein ACYC9Q_04030 [Bacillota bacterium]